MIKLGKYQTLSVSRSVDFGVYLHEDGDSKEVLLPARYVPENLKPGDSIDVFIYNDSEDRLVATTEHPYATVGQFAFLEVKEVNDVGAFIDWGLIAKDLLVPYGEQRVKMRRGGIYLVYIYVDKTTDRIVASARIDRFLGNVFPDYKPGDKVEALVYEHAEIGYKAIVNNLHRGMIYTNEIYRPIELEENIKAFVKRVRPDGRIDLTLNDISARRTATLSEDILEYLHRPDAGPVSDKSSPERIQMIFNCSKKDFKKAVGHLYREHKIALAVDGTITLV